MEKIWKIQGNDNTPKDNPEKILNDYAKRLKEDTNKKFEGLVTETIIENTGIVKYALFIVTPELKHYMYKLIEVKLQNMFTFYPLEITLLAKAQENHKTYTCDDVSELKKRAIEFISSPVTSGILMHLKTMIEIKNTSLN